MLAILKVFNCYLLPNRKSDGVETWWKTSGQHGDLELLKWFHSDIQDGMATITAILKSSNHICYRTVSPIELKHDGSHWGVMEIQNC